MGGGFAGIYCAKTLLKHKDVQVTLVNPTNYFLFVPMLHEVAGGSLSIKNIAETIREILFGRNFSFVQGTVCSIDLKKKVAVTLDVKIPYDYLVLATGSEANFFNVPGADKFCFTLKNADDAHNLKLRIISAVEQSFCDCGDKEALSSIVVVGAGATGVELSLEIKELLDQLLRSSAHNNSDGKVYLINSGDVPVPHFPRLQKNVLRALEKHKIILVNQTSVTEVLPDGVALLHQEKNKKEILKAGTIVWTAGVKPRTVKTVPSVFDARGFYPVNDFLQVQGSSNVFAAGDCALFMQDGKPIPMLAQVATHQGVHVARNILNAIHGDALKPFMFHVQGILMSLGKGKGVGVIWGVKISGFFAWWIMRTVYLFKILGVVNRLKAAYEWSLDLFVKRDTKEV